MSRSQLPSPDAGVTPYCSSLFRCKGGVMRAELAKDHKQPVSRLDQGLWIRSRESGVVTCWAHHWWADTPGLSVYGPSYQTAQALPMLAGWRVHVQHTG